MKLFTEKGEVNRETFRVSAGNWFVAQTILEGVGPTTDIEASSFAMFGYDSRWTENESTWSEIELVFRYDFVRNQTTVEAFNITQRYAYVYGPFQDWVLVEKTGFHWEWNTAIADYAWVNGTYKEWQYIETTGYHWAYEFFNRSSGLWESGWAPRRSSANI